MANEFVTRAYENHPKETKRLIGIDYEQLQQLFTRLQPYIIKDKQRKRYLSFEIALELDVNLNFPG